MGSLSQALSIALSGLQASSSLIALASNNISNASTPGYTEKTADPVPVDFGSSFGGVEIASYSRSTNQALSNNFNNATSANGYSSTQNGYMQQIQTILDSSSNNPTISNDIANFASAWTNYTSDPESTGQQQAVISAGRTLANDINTATAQVGSLKVQIQSDITTSVTSLNADLQQVASLNQSIQSASASGQPTVDLQDALDTAVNKISSFMNVSVQSRNGGQIALYTPSGQLLVDGNSAKQFSYNGTAIVDSNGTDVTSAFSGGSLQAATQFIDSSASAAASTVPGVGVIAKIQAQLSTLVGSLTSTTSSSSFASTYAAAVTASTATGATQAGQTVATSFFTVALGSGGQPDPSSFAINTTLPAGTAALPQTGIQAIANSFTSVSTYTTSGLSAPSQTYAGLASAIISSFQQTANTINTQSTAAASQQTYYQQALSNKTGVNTDTELANLVAYQNSYAASAHVISTVNQMLTTLMSVIA